jgi:hypothetical protein
MSEKCRQKEKGQQRISANPLIILARPERFELPTARFVAEYSIQLSYGRIVWYFIAGLRGTF